jgi:hypothetical protein
MPSGRSPSPVDTVSTRTAGRPATVVSSRDSSSSVRSSEPETRSKGTGSTETVTAIPAFVTLQRRIVKHRAAIDAALDSELSNALIASTNTKIRLITHVAFGFHGPELLIADAMLSLGAHPPVLPGGA